MIKRFALVLTTALLLPLSAMAGETPSAEGAKVFFKNIEDGATVSSPVMLEFGIEGMMVMPAGSEDMHSGHHHLLINTTLSGDDFDYAIENDEQHRHFGKGQTETSIELSPGSHTLQLVLGDGGHVPHNPPVMSDVITITVE